VGDFLVEWLLHLATTFPWRLDTNFQELLHDERCWNEALSG